MPPTKATFPAQGNAEATFTLEDEVLGEHFTRNLQFFGSPGQERIMGAFVIVVGLGVRLPGLLLFPEHHNECIFVTAATCCAFLSCCSCLSRFQWGQ